jgi:CheY-like chemotaxis protein
MTNIVIVDDDPGVQEAFRYVFDPVKYNVTVSPNGTTILSNECPVPDIYILDKQLSGVDGLDICRHLKERKETKHIPVIIITASPNMVRQAAAAGADNILEKPFEIQVLRKMVADYTGAY